MDKKRIIEQIGHELKTPLTSIKGFSELLRSERVVNDTQKRDRYLEIINRNSDRLHNAILSVQEMLWSYLHEVNDE